MAHTPYRTGVTTLFRYLRLICNLVVRFRPQIEKIWNPSQMEQLDQLTAICEIILAFPNPRPYDE